jgi:ferric-dicitrate binding protein FerR (iron transport regulator)
MKENRKIFKIISTGKQGSMNRKFLDKSEFSTKMMKFQWDKSDDKPGRYEDQSDLDTLWKSIEIETNKAKIIPLKLNTLLKYAAIFLFGIFSFMMGRYITKETMQDTNFYLAENPPGTISEMRLPDNSRVWLNAGSSIRYNEGFGANHRELALKGEAIFEVRKNTDLPFQVSVNDIHVVALGTEFYVSAYSFQDNLAAGLIEGSIKINNGSESYILNERKSILIDPESGDLLSRGPLNPSYYEWRNGKLIFENTELSKICHRLSNWYNHKINLEEGIENQKFTLTIKEENLEEVLELIVLASDITFNRTEEGFYLHSSSK